MRPRLTYANVVATMALFIALGGASYAALKLPKNSVGTKQLKKNAVNGSKVKNNSLTGEDFAGSVADASHAAHADLADSATNATHATSADSASNASLLAGNGPSAFIQASQIGSFITAPEVENVGGVIGCESGPNRWQDLSPNVNNVVQYWRDPYGVVHLRGVALRCGSVGATIFTLPSGFRPGHLEHLAAVASTGTVQVTVDGGGAVVSPIAVEQWQSLDGITFRAES
jgi:hypothetical protein